MKQFDEKKTQALENGTDLPSNVDSEKQQKRENGNRQILIQSFV